MARHKKKKFPPTPDPNDSKNKDESEENKPENPPTENPPTEKKDLPKIEHEKIDEELIQNKRNLDKLFWLRIGLAVMSGIAATFIFDSIEGEERRWTSIGFMILIFIASIVIAKSMNLAPARLGRKKIVTTGIGSFVFLYLFMWIVSYTLVNVTGNDASSMIPFP
ncbi:MAG: hypothetical protein V3T67_03755 [Nitrosopumilaceae archaeon]